MNLCLWKRVKNNQSGLEEAGVGNLYLWSAGDGWKALIARPSLHTVSEDANKRVKSVTLRIHSSSIGAILQRTYTTSYKYMLSWSNRYASSRGTLLLGFFCTTFSPRLKLCKLLPALGFLFSARIDRTANTVKSLQNRDRRIDHRWAR